jgi:ABC-2 type transport system permease protein
VVAVPPTPLLVVWAVLAARLAIHFGDLSIAGTAALAYLVLVLPGLAFVAAFGLVMPRLVGVRLYQVLFIGYWFWGNLVPQHVMPTLSGTWLTPIGKYADAGLFAHSSHSLLLTGGGSTAAAYGSIALLAGIAVLLLTVFGLAERRRLR